MAEISELRQAALDVSALEKILTDVASILDAIDAGEMLANLPADDRDACLHNSAVSLLDLAQRRLEDAELIRGTDVSIRLHVMADDQHRRLKTAA